ncbi:MAG: DUF4910 domain-containing protein [Candidatus Hodarchaeales archaeon]|jgi:hypothetical protein
MKINELIDVITDEFSIHSTMNMVSRLSQFHRIQGSKGYLDSARYIQSVLVQNGIDSTLHEYPADGKSDNWGWIAPISWDIKSGECWLIKPVKKRLCRFIDCPMSVLTHSNKANFEATLVDVGKGDKSLDYKIAKGKIALITASPRNVFSLAKKHDVKGLILHPDLDRAAKIGDSTTQYDGFWPIAENISDVTSGFSISHKQARELIQYLKKEGEVKVQFKIDASFSLDTGKLHVLDTEIIGSERPEDEIIIIGHLCHPAPSANDNASGSATALELALSLTRLINSGVIAPPKRTIRFLWVPEFSGTIPWLKKYDDLRNITKRKILAVFNLDMVGQSQEKIGTPLTIGSPSISTPSYLRAILKFASECATEYKEKRNGRNYRLNFTLVPFQGGSDQLIFNDQYFSIPSVMFGHEDPFHHTSADDIDKVDPFECRSAGAIIGTIAYELSTSSKLFFKEAIFLVFLEIIQETMKTEFRLKNCEELSESQKSRLWELLEDLGLRKIQSLTVLDEQKYLKEDVNHFVELIKSHFEYLRRKLKASSDDTTSEKIGEAIIKRNYLGPLPITRLMKPSRREYEQTKLDNIGKDYWGGVVLELLNLANGNTSLEDIFLLLKIHYPNVSYGDVLFMVNLFIEERILIEEKTSILSSIE